MNATHEFAKKHDLPLIQAVLHENQLSTLATGDASDLGVLILNQVRDIDDNMFPSYDDIFTRKILECFQVRVRTNAENKKVFESIDAIGGEEVE